MFYWQLFWCLVWCFTWILLLWSLLEVVGFDLFKYHECGRVFMCMYFGAQKYNHRLPVAGGCPHLCGPRPVNSPWRRVENHLPQIQRHLDPAGVLPRLSHGQRWGQDPGRSGHLWRWGPCLAGGGLGGDCLQPRQPPQHGHHIARKQRGEADDCAHQTSAKLMCGTQFWFRLGDVGEGARWPSGGWGKVVKNQNSDVLIVHYWSSDSGEIEVKHNFLDNDSKLRLV